MEQNKLPKGSLSAGMGCSGLVNLAFLLFVHVLTELRCCWSRERVRGDTEVSSRVFRRGGPVSHQLPFETGSF